MTPKKPLEDILAEYTEDLHADRKPRLAEEAATLSEEDRAELVELLALVRRLKAVHREAPPPREGFLESLDQFVREETARQVALDPAVSHRQVSVPEKATAGEKPLLLRGRILKGVREILMGLTAPEAGGRWRFAAVVAVVIVFGLQVLLYLQVRRLEEQNQMLVARLEQMSPSGNVVPLGLPREPRAGVRKGAEKGSGPSLDDLLIGVELRVRIEQRIGELEKEAEAKTGKDRQDTELLLRELRALLQSSSRP